MILNFCKQEKSYKSLVPFEFTSTILCYKNNREHLLKILYFPPPITLREDETVPMASLDILMVITLRRLNVNSLMPFFMGLTERLIKYYPKSRLGS